MNDEIEKRTDKICERIDGCLSTLRIAYQYLEDNDDIEKWDLIGILDIIFPILLNCSDEVGEIALEIQEMEDEK